MTPKFFDAHTHLNMQFEKDWREVGRRTIDNDTYFVNVGADEESSRLALEQVKELGNGAWCTVGLHPTESNDSNFETIKNLAKDEKVVAIGECGLEYFQLPVSTKDSVIARQKELFKKHIELALTVGKPLMIHCRSAYADVYEILSDYKKTVGDKLQFNMHFFTSDWSTAKKFLDLGGYLSFPGVITFTDQYDEMIKKMPLDRIMAETDAPFATPVPHRGARNEPAYVQFVAERIIDLRPESKGEILTALVENAGRFYGFDFSKKS